MKRLFLTVVFIAVSGIVSANTIANETQTDSTAPTGNVCCIRSATSAGGEVVTVRGCVPSTGDAAVDTGKACARAQSAVTALTKALEASPAD